MENKKANESKNRSLIVTILVAVIVVLVIGSIAGYAIYRQEIEPFETVVLRIDDKVIKMRYFLKRLVYYEETSDVNSAIEREKQIKGWLRSRKIALVESRNREWRDLSEGWFG